MKKTICMAFLILLVLPGLSYTSTKVMDDLSRFIKSDGGVIKDTQTGFEWIVGPDESTTWYMAKSWVNSLAVAGGGWRLPTKAELETLYIKGVGTRNISPLFKTTGWWVWSAGDRNTSTAWGFSFKYGYSDWLSKTKYVHSRGFAVRSLNDKAEFLSQDNIRLKRRIAVLDNELEMALKHNTEEHIKLKADYDSSQIANQKLTKENKRLMLSQKNRLIITGVVLLLCGLIGGFFVGGKFKKQK